MADKTLFPGHRRFYLRSSLELMLDIERVKRWVSYCKENHSDCDLKLPAGGVPGLRVIDVIDSCLREGVQRPSYVALSYVWGAVTNFRLTTANKPRLMQHGALEDVWEMMPITIRDAISLTRKLGRRYLWVDSLCLLQNDEADIQQGVDVMDKIYEHSWLTVVGAGGHDANAGLFGIHPGDRREDEIAREVRPGIFIGVYSGVRTYLKASVYETRA